MDKRFRTALSMIMLITFLIISANPAEARLLSKLSTFSPYTAIVTANVLNIHTSPSLGARVTGTYSKGTVVTITGQSGNFAKTSRGYIWAAYTALYKKVTAGTSKAPAFQAYKVTITTTRLNIRKGPSTAYSIAGYYYKGNIVDVIGKSGSFLKTSKGYIAESYTALYKSVTSGSSQAPAFQAYKVTITTTRLNIRKGPSTAYSIAGYYYKGNVVDVIGKSGSFLKTSKGYIAASYTALYKPVTSGTSGAPAFQPYKVTITTAKLSIRKGPSTAYSVVGYYLKGNIVDVTGQSGSYLKTSKGYIYSAYTKKYTAPTTTPPSTQPPAPAFQPYQVIITAAVLNVRKSASDTAAIVGSYYKDNIVDIIGQAGNYLQTSLGYISAAFTKKYVTPSRGGTEDQGLVGKYVKILADTPLLIDADGTTDERYVLKDQTFQIQAQSGDFYRIKVGKLYGYINSSNTSLIDQTAPNMIKLGWDYFYSKLSETYYDTHDDYVKERSTDSGINVLSPTWLYMTGDSGNPSSINVAEKANRKYVTYAHNNGYQVWALFQEFNYSRAYKEFYDPAVKARVISQIINYAQQFNLDGINLDFEGIGSLQANRDGLTAFVKDLSTAMKSAGLILSIDVTRPASVADTWIPGNVYSNFYNRPALAGYVDYMFLMAYDEHYAGSNAGSVGSYPWVDDSIRTTLAQGVPKEKLVLGVPFYLRDYTLPTNSIVYQVSSKLYSAPAGVSSTIANAGQGYAYKYLGETQDYYQVDYNGQTGYIAKADTVEVGQNTDAKTVDPTLDIILPYDSVVVMNQTSLYTQPSTTDGTVIGSVNAGYAYKCTVNSTLQDWYQIDYNGTTAYIPQGDASFVPQGTNFQENASVPGIILPYDSVVVKNTTGVFNTPPAPADGSNVIMNTKLGDAFTYVSDASTPGWYIVSYSGGQAYAPKSDTIHINVGGSSTRPITSAAVGYFSTMSKVSQYGGTVYNNITNPYDNSKQNVAVYYNSYGKHVVWLEDADSMSWRMDLINNYGLSGMGGWSLDWGPSDDIMNVIKTKLK